MEFQVRRYIQQDREALEALIEDYIDYFVDIDPLKRTRKAPGYARFLLEKMLEQTERKSGAIFIAMQDGEVIGFIAGILEQSTPEQELDSVPFRSGRVIEFFVRAEFRQQGVGTALLQSMEAHFADLDCDTMRLEVFEPNRLAHDFYLKRGYQDRVIDMLKELPR